MKLIDKGVKGSGYFCIVKKRWDENTGNFFAVKELKKEHFDNKSYKYRLRREIHLLEELKGCSEIIELIDSGIDEEKMKLWYIMPLADQNLYDFIKINNQKLVSVRATTGLSLYL